MKSYIGKGERMDYANAGSAIASGDVVPLGGRIGVAAVAIAATTGVGAVWLEGVFQLTKHSGETFAQGDRLWWDSGNARLTKTAAAGLYLAGTAWSAAASSDVVANVLLESEAMVPQAANVAAVAGTLTGTVDGTIVDTAASACAGGSTPTAAQVDTAIASLATSVNVQLKEIVTILNAEIAALKLVNLQASS